jgi:hypothetical protein
VRRGLTGENRSTIKHFVRQARRTPFPPSIAWPILIRKFIPFFSIPFFQGGAL